MNISDIDKNFRISADFDTSGFDIYDINQNPFEINGLILPHGDEGIYRRMPKKVAEKVSDSVLYLSGNTSGGRVRFKTSSHSVAIFAVMGQVGRMSHFPLTGSSGFDLYADGIYAATFVPPYDMQNGYSSIKRIERDGEKDIVINFPLYSEVKALSIGLDKGASLYAPSGYKIKKPVVYYGSSITQGGCASRPGNSYQAIISRKLGCDYINLGLSGSALAERAIAEYIASLEMSAFVYDYDHNAPTPQFLEQTHKPMFDIIRSAQPKLPIVIVSMPRIYLTDREKERLAIIRSTYETAKAKGDENVFFIDGSKMMREYSSDSGTVDGSHPNDYGFVGMAECIGNVLSKIFNK